MKHFSAWYLELFLHLDTLNDPFLEMAARNYDTDAVVTQLHAKHRGSEIGQKLLVNVNSLLKYRTKGRGKTYLAMSLCRAYAGEDSDMQLVHRYVTKVGGCVKQKGWLDEEEMMFETMAYCEYIGRQNVQALVKSWGLLGVRKYLKGRKFANVEISDRAHAARVCLELCPEMETEILERLKDVPSCFDKDCPRIQKIGKVRNAKYTVRAIIRWALSLD